MNNYTLIINTAEEEHQVFNPTINDIKDCISLLKQDPIFNFIILETSTPINNVTFIQATSYEENSNEVIIEVQILDKSKSFLRNYGRHILIDELQEILLNFLIKQTPNIDNWECKWEGPLSD